MMSLPEDILAGVPEIAAFIRKTERATYHLIYADELPVFRVGKKIHARKSDLERRFQSGVA